MSSQNRTEYSFCQKHKIKLEKLGPHIFCIHCIKEEIKDPDRYQYASVNVDSDKEIDYLSLGIPINHINSSFENYQLEYKLQKQIFDRILQYTSEISSGFKGDMILLGREGTGKTHLACAMLKELAVKGKNIKFITSYELTNYFIENWGNRSFFESNEITKFAQYDVLIIDEYGFNDQKDAQKAYLEKILYKRYDCCKSTVIISNLFKDSIEESLGHRVWSRLNQNDLLIHQFQWHDYRLQNRAC